MSKGKYAERAKTKRAADGATASAIRQQNALRAELRRMAALPAENQRLRDENARLRGGLADDMLAKVLECREAEWSAVKWEQALVDLTIHNYRLCGVALSMSRDLDLEHKEPRRYAEVIELTTNLNRPEERSVRRAVKAVVSGRVESTTAVTALIQQHSGGTPKRRQSVKYAERRAADLRKEAERLSTEVTELRKQLRKQVSNT